MYIIHNPEAIQRYVAADWVAQNVVVPLSKHRKSVFGDVYDDARQVGEVFARVFSARIGLKMKMKMKINDFEYERSIQWISVFWVYIIETRNNRPGYT